jgi:hypothetical protein
MHKKLFLPHLCDYHSITGSKSEQTTNTNFAGHAYTPGNTITATHRGNCTGCIPQDLEQPGNTGGYP